jgi:hypothetical protein
MGDRGSPAERYSGEAVLVVDGNDVPVVLETFGGMDGVGKTPARSGG